RARGLSASVLRRPGNGPLAGDRGEQPAALLEAALVVADPVRALRRVDRRAKRREPEELTVRNRYRGGDSGRVGRWRRGERQRRRRQRRDRAEPRTRRDATD